MESDVNCLVSSLQDRVERDNWLYLFDQRYTVSARACRRTRKALQQSKEPDPSEDGVPMRENVSSADVQQHLVQELPPKKAKMCHNQEGNMGLESIPQVGVSG